MSEEKCDKARLTESANSSAKESGESLAAADVVADTNYSETEQKQKEHYESIASEYESHYGDRYSNIYRDKFIYDRLFNGIDLNNKKVLDAMCGNGPTSEYLLGKGSLVTSLDISENLLASLKKRNPECKTINASILETGLEDQAYDCVVIIGGLHHLHPDLNMAVTEVHRILKPGGYFCFMEPHTGSIMDTFRRLWYKCDRLFEDNEAAVDIDRLSEEHSHEFRTDFVKYFGSFAYMFVLNSMVFRVPLRMKKFYFRIMMKIEELIDGYHSKKLSCVALCRMQKRV